MMMMMGSTAKDNSMESIDDEDVSLCSTTTGQEAQSEQITSLETISIQDSPNENNDRDDEPEVMNCCSWLLLIRSMLILGCLTFICVLKTNDKFWFYFFKKFILTQQLTFLGWFEKVSRISYLHHSI